MTAPAIQWYPGHIAKAEKALREQLKLVDVVFEVRDARIPLATHHPQMMEWIGMKPRLLVLNRVDMIPEQARQQWQSWFRLQGDRVYFTNAQKGSGIEFIIQSAQEVGETVNQRRQSRGLLPRPVRAAVIGFPNVGKSALINRLLKQRVVQSERRPGVTRQLRWVRMSHHLELLDAPGVLPSKLIDQSAATKLAICDDIGEAAYNHQTISTVLIELCKSFPGNAATNALEAFKNRYTIDPHVLTGEDYLANLAEFRYQGDQERTAQHILNDFRKGQLGAISLEWPPSDPPVWMNS